MFLTVLMTEREDLAKALGPGILRRIFAPDKLLKKTLGVAGYVEIGLEVAGDLFGPEADDGTTPVDTKGGPEIRVVDEDLARIAGDYYQRPGGADHETVTLADLVYHQRVTGDSVGGPNWEARAVATRDVLKAWVTSQHAADSSPGTDVDYANGLIDNLDKALEAG